jgi:teichuronic acid biosynthesis glycosyltransferase TuaC
LVATVYKPKGRLLVIENAVNTHLFYPREKKASRQFFRLPEKSRIIGTAGALDENRGIGILYAAFDCLYKENPNLILAVAGSGSREHPIFKHPNIRDFGMLSNEDVAVFLNVLDVAIICNKDSDFGRYCFPQKAYEILATGIPMVSANVGAMAAMLQKYPECLFDPLDTTDLSKKITVQLTTPTRLEISVNTWAKQAEKLEKLMKGTNATFGQ